MVKRSEARMQTDEPSVSDGVESVRGLGPDNDDVSSTGNDLFAIDGHCHFAGADDASFGMGMLMQSRTFPGLKLPSEKGDAGTVWLALELHRGDCALGVHG